MRGFTRVSVAVPVVAVANAAANAAATAALWQQADDDGAAIVVFPELGLSSYSARDLFFDNTLQQSVEAALAVLLERSRSLAPLAVVGLPLAETVALLEGEGFPVRRNWIARGGAVA